MRSHGRVLVLAAILLVLLPALLAACPLCKDALEDKTTGLTNDLGRGFYYSILLMVSAPFLVVGGIFLRILRARRRVGTAVDPAAASRLSPDAPGARS